jgi:hypothetical protein
MAFNSFVLQSFAESAYAAVVVAAVPLIMQ